MNHTILAAGTHELSQPLPPVHGPLQVLPHRIGGRTTCLYRDAEVVLTSWTDAPNHLAGCLTGTVKRKKMAGTV